MSMFADGDYALLERGRPARCSKMLQEPGGLNPSCPDREAEDHIHDTRLLDFHAELSSPRWHHGEDDIL